MTRGGPKIAQAALSGGLSYRTVQIQQALDQLNSDPLGWSLPVPSICHADGQVVPIVCRYLAADPISRPEIT